MGANTTIQPRPRQSRFWPRAFAAALMLILIPASVRAGKITYSYDGAGRLTAAELGDSGLTTYLYDANGNLLTQTTAPATNADVRIIKNSPTTATTVGNNLTYTLTVTNAGPTAATGVTVTDPFPFGLLLSSANPSQGSISFENHTLTANIGVLPANSSATITMLVFHGLTNTATNVAMVTVNQPDPNLANNVSSDVTTGLGPANDSDNDGMPNWWESLNGISPFSTGNPNGATHDRDGDGITNFDEWIADTRANDASSFFHVEDITLGTDGVSLSFQSSPIRRYVGLVADNAAGPFTGFITNDGTGALMTFTDTNAPAGTRFYLLEVQLP